MKLLEEVGARILVLPNRGEMVMYNRNIEAASSLEILSLL